MAKNKRDLSGSSFMSGFTDEYLAAVGRVVMAWPHVEQKFEMMFLSEVVMLGVSSGSMTNPRVKLMGEPFLKRIDLFKERLKAMGFAGPDYEETSHLLGRLKVAARERNRIAHSITSAMFTPEGGFNPAVASTLEKSWKNDKPYEWKTLSLVELQALYDELHNLFWELFDLNMWRPWRGGRRPPSMD